MRLRGFIEALLRFVKACVGVHAVDGLPSRRISRYNHVQEPFAVAA
jgi:hypothetical protein